MTAIATARQSVCDRPGSILINKTNDNEETTIKVEYNECAPWIIEIRNSYFDLKEAVNEVTKVFKFLTIFFKNEGLWSL